MFGTVMTSRSPASDVPCVVYYDRWHWKLISQVNSLQPHIWTATLKKMCICHFCVCANVWAPSCLSVCVHWWSPVMPKLPIWSQEAVGLTESSRVEQLWTSLLHYSQRFKPDLLAQQHSLINWSIKGSCTKILQGDQHLQHIHPHHPPTNMVCFACVICPYFLCPLVFSFKHKLQEMYILFNHIQIKPLWPSWGYCIWCFPFPHDWETVSQISTG